jgi:phytoene dehydrogenase-like protein
VTEEVWPGQRVSRASYVVSMLHRKVVKDLELTRFGYEAIPLDPPFATIGADGRPIFFDEEGPFEEFLARMARIVRPVLLMRPPRLAGRRDLIELYRLMTMSVGDLLDEWFEDDVIKGAYASTGVVGVWAGPRTPGTAYNLLHHALGELDGVPGAWGHVRGGMGAISNALARSAESKGAIIRTNAPVQSIDVRDGRVTGVTLERGEHLTAPLVVSGALFSVIVFASFIGTVTPLILNRYGYNPALAAGPFITTINDLLGLTVYFLTVHLFLR